MDALGQKLRQKREEIEMGADPLAPPDDVDAIGQRAGIKDPAVARYLMSMIQGAKPSAPPPQNGLSEAQQHAAESRGWNSIQRGAVGVGAAIAGVKPDYAAVDQQRDEADAPVRGYIQQRVQESADVQAGQTKRRAALDDPNSEESKAAVGFWVERGLVPPEAVGRLAGSKVPGAEHFVEESARRRTATDAEMKRKQALGDQAERDKRLHGYEMEQIGARRRGMGGGAPKTGPGNRPGTVIAGMEIVDGADPTKEDATKVKAANDSAEQIRSSVRELKALYAKSGTELLPGAAKTRMQQLITGIQLQAKNIAELGALSGPDQTLMENLAGADPTSFGQNLAGLFGRDTVESSLDELEAWTGRQLESKKKVYGYRDAEQPRRNGSSGNFSLESPPPPSPGMVRIRDPQSGRTGWADADSIPEGVEVIDG